MIREDLIRIMMQMGIKSNWEKMVKAEAQWAGEEPEVFGPKIAAWIDRTASKEDWGLVQGWFDIFKNIKGRVDTMAWEQCGASAQDEPAVPIVTRHETYDGGHTPLIYELAVIVHQRRENRNTR
jgi:hypothetical protein